ncbi:hypothetical protein [Rhizobium brockwellii]|uniref:hypothetical protein n=1 Tax=Rhizobium brockwellii TaxID=3019932 RepID=UPI00293DA8B6|nr:hypothetical protein [Rhizobium brockwellii]MDV4159316.1 hypothetical protein [Rhizobium brockwellii]
MSVYFMTAKAKPLLDNFKARIAQTEAKGKITTWEVEENGDFTHKAADWTEKAWFRPAVMSDRLRFDVVWPADQQRPVPVYAYYHGHLIETFVNHFENELTLASATPPKRS